MSLIKCNECGKEISDQAYACPNCGCPITKPTVPIQNNNVHNQHKKRSIKIGCIIPIIIFIILCVAVSVGISDMEKHPEKYDTSRITNKYIDVTVEEGKKIDAILNDCGINKVKNIEKNESLNNAYGEGSTGYYIKYDDNTNIIMYLNADNTVYAIYYSDHELYANNSIVATLQDYILSTDDAAKWMSRCETKVEEILVSPSTAKFPNMTEWRFGKEKNILTVQGYVDSQNKLGAEIRSNFQFIIDVDTETITSFIFDGQEIIGQ